MTEIPTIRLNNGVHIPQLGFGVFQVPPEQTAQVVLTAFEAGYRSIDTATGYRNEKGVGDAVRASGLDRGDVFVTTKLANSDHGYDAALAAFDRSLGELGMDYVDLYLVHWPQPAKDLYAETWRALEKIHADGRARSIGVSNFQISHLRRLAAETTVVPAVNQIELHPRLQQAELRAYHREQGIATEAWSPLAKGGALLRDRVITSLAEKYGKTPAQLVLRWHLELGNIVIPKSVTPERIKENTEIVDFELSRDDIASISGLETGARTGPHPDQFG